LRSFAKGARYADRTVRLSALVAIAAVALLVVVDRSANAAEPSAAPPPAPPTNPATDRPPSPTDDPAGHAGSTRFAQDLEKGAPPPSNIVYFQYGVAFVTEQILSPGPICDNPSRACILGAGGGIVVRGGWRSKGPLYIGGAYELTKQDPNKLYRIALLQQARAEMRYYFMTARVTEPYLGASLGVAGYGNEWQIDTWGPAGSLGAGVEYQISRSIVVGLAFAYRLLYLSRFTDTSGAARDPGVAQLLGLDLVLEQRDSFLTTRDRDAK
jgi:hypothetical protein